jgi:hypothetical protein
VGLVVERWAETEGERVLVGFLRERTEPERGERRCDCVWGVVGVLKKCDEEGGILDSVLERFLFTGLDVGTRRRGVGLLPRPPECGTFFSAAE